MKVADLFLKMNVNGFSQQHFHSKTIQFYCSNMMDVYSLISLVHNFDNSSSSKSLFKRRRFNSYYSMLACTENSNFALGNNFGLTALQTPKHE